MKVSFHSRLTGSLVVNAAGAAALFFSQFFVAHFAGVETFGIFALLFASLQLIVVATKAGFDTASQRLIAEYLVNDEGSLIRGLLISSVAIVGLLSACAAVLFVGGAHVFGEPDWGGDAILAAALLIPVVALLRLTRGSLLGFQLTVRAQIYDPLLIYAGWMFLIALDLLREIELTAGRLMLELLLASVLGLAGQLFQLIAAIPENARSARSEYRLRQWFEIALPMLLAYGLVIVLSYTDTILIGIFLGSDMAGVYALSSRFAAAVSLPMAFLGGALGPVVAEMIARKDLSTLQSRIRSTTRLGLSLGLPVALVLLVGGGFMLEIIGEGYAIGVTAMQVLVVAQVVNIIVGPVGLVLLMSGEQRRVGRIFAITAVFNLLLNIVLIPVLGIVGAAIATALAIVLRNLLLRSALARTHGLDTWAFRQR